MHRRAFVATAGATLAGGCVDSNARPDDPATSKTNDSSVEEADVVITMTNEPSFNPDSVEIGVGETVRWKNDSRQIHTVTAYGDRIPDEADYFASGGAGKETLATIVYPLDGGIQPNEVFVHRFETPGHYEYYSIPTEHLGMVGEVTVR